MGNNSSAQEEIEQKIKHMSLNVYLFDNTESIITIYEHYTHWCDRIFINISGNTNKFPEIKIVGKVPENFIYGIFCDFINLEYIPPKLPNELLQLTCWSKRLTSLPKLPDRLRWLECPTAKLSPWYNNNWKRGEDLVAKIRKKIKNKKSCNILIKNF